MQKEKIKQVWIIDDDEVIKYLTELMFKQVNFCEQSIYFSNPKEGLNQLQAANASKAELPEIILLDLRMPEMDGWTFLNEMQNMKLHQEIAVFIFSSSINEDDILRSQQYSIVKDYIIKPLTIHKLNKILRQLG